MEGAEKEVKFLIVDDESSTLCLCENALKGLVPSLVLNLADSGEKALTLIEQNGADYSLLFSDIYMAGVDGLEVARRMREINKKVFIVLTSTEKHDELLAYLALPELRQSNLRNSTSQLAQLMVDGIVDKFLHKNGGVDDLRKAIAFALKEAWMRPELEEMKKMSLNDVLLKLHEAKDYSQEKNNGGGVILVVDDEKNIRTMVGRILNKCKDFEIVEACDPKDALEKIDQIGKDRITVVISDTRMGGSDDGPKFLRELHEDPAFKDVLAVLMSGTSFETDYDIRELVNRGIIKFFLSKPFGYDDLLGPLKASAIRQCKAIKLEKNS